MFRPRSDHDNLWNLGANRPVKAPGPLRRRDVREDHRPIRVGGWTKVRPGREIGRDQDLISAGRPGERKGKSPGGRLVS